MKLESKYDIGQKVYAVSSHCNITYPKIRISCDTCDSTGKVLLKGKEYTCPECKGEYEEDYDNPKRFFPKPSTIPLTIGQVRIEVTKKETTIEYMCKETGIGSGRIYYENRLFTTYDKALEFVEKANEELANGKHWSEL